MDTTQMQRREITAFYDDRHAADRAMLALSQAGIASSEIRLVEGQNSGEEIPDNRGFFEMLGDFFMPDEDRSTYAEGLRRGGYMIGVTTTDTYSDTVLDILDDEGSVDMDNRAESWKAEGWSSQSSGGVGSGGGAMGTMAGGMISPETMGGGTLSMNDQTRRAGWDDTTSGSESLGSLESSDADSTLFGSEKGTSSNDDTIQVVAEQLQVGKRDVANGRLRVRSYVVEEPVNADVSLRSERVQINRTPVDRPATGLEDAFRDRTIEVEATSEEAVIAKNARVVEEISINKTAETRTETVSDTVRRTEVEIDDERSTEPPLRDDQRR